MRSRNRSSLSRATFTASLSPHRQSRSESVDRKISSLITAHGTAKLPRKFLVPKALIPFLTPIPPSAWASVVVGIRTSLTPRWAVAAAKPTTSSTAPPPITRTYEWRQIPSSWIDRAAASKTDQSFLAASPPGTRRTGSDSSKPERPSAKYVSSRRGRSGQDSTTPSSMKASTRPADISAAPSTSRRIGLAGSSALRVIRNRCRCSTGNAASTGTAGWPWPLPCM